jgi:hypothetical protein
VKDSQQTPGRFEGPQGLSEEQGARLLAYRSGSMSLSEQRHFEDELLSSPELARALYEAEGLESVLRMGRPVGKKRRRLPRRLLIPLAAAAILAVVFLPHPSLRTPLEPAPVFRGSEGVLTALSPVGTVAGPKLQFRWSSFPKAQRYRIEVFDVNSHEIFEVVSQDTSAVVEASQLANMKNGAGFWRVTALGELDAQLTRSAPAPLRLSAGN